MPYRVAPHVHHRSLDGEVIILNGNGNTYLGLNRSGAVIWETITRGGSVHDAASALSARFQIAPDLAAADASAFVGQLVEAGLLEADDA